MTTTTLITELPPHELDLTAYVGDFAGDFDMAKVRADYLTLINDELPEGITVHANGQVYATLDQADTARDIRWHDFLEQLDVEPIFERHEVKPST
jgi:hypothetical protein